MSRRRLPFALTLCALAAALPTAAQEQPLAPPARQLDTAYRLILTTYNAPPDERTSVRIVTTDGAPLDVRTESAGDMLVFYESPLFFDYGGGAIYTVQQLDGTQQIHVDPGSGATTPILDATDRVYRNPALSPDELRLAIQSALIGDGAEDDLFLVGLDGSELVQLTDTPDISERLPTWSPDGQSLAYLIADDAESRIMVISIDGGEPIEIAELDLLPTSLVWSPDGRILFSAYTGDDEIESGPAIYAISAEPDSKNTPALLYELAAVSDSGASIDHINVSSDGQRVAYISTELRLTETGTMRAQSSIHILDLTTGEVFVPALDTGGSIITGFDWY